jgi:two-component system, OmpR family, response regulator MtrA
MTKPLAFIVEDDPQLSQIFTLVLRERFETIAISDGLQALAQLSETVPALVVLDINLPGASGREILSVIRSVSRFESTRVIITTADSHVTTEVQEKADIVLLKPVSVSQLRDLAARLKP